HARPRRDGQAGRRPTARNALAARRSAPGAVDDRRILEAAVGDAPSHLFPFAKHAALPAGNVRPAGSGDGLVLVDGLPGDDVERADVGDEGLDDVHGPAVVPVAYYSHRQARRDRLLEVRQGEFDVLPRVRRLVLDPNYIARHIPFGQRGAELAGLDYAVVAVDSASGNDQGR